MWKECNSSFHRFDKDIVARGANGSMISSHEVLDVTENLSHLQRKGRHDVNHQSSKGINC